MPTGSALSLVFSRSSGQVIVYLHGALDAVTAHQLSDRLADLIGGQGNRQVVLDLAGLTHIDAVGLSSLLDALKSVRDIGGELVLSGLTSGVHRTFEAAGVDKLFFITPAWMHPANGSPGADDWRRHEAQ